MAMTEKEKKELKEKQIINGHNHKNNLRPINTLPYEEQKAIRQKGQKAMIENGKKNKSIKTICNEILNLSAMDIAKDIISKELIEQLKENGIDLSYYDLVVIKQLEQAINNKDTKAAVFLRDSNGDKPTDKIEQDINVITENDQKLLQSINDRLESLESIETTYKSE